MAKRVLWARCYGSPLPYSLAVSIADKVASASVSHVLTKCLAGLVNGVAGPNSGVSCRVIVPQLGPHPIHVGLVIKVLSSSGPSYISSQLLRGDGVDYTGKKLGSGREIIDNHCVDSARECLFGDGYYPRLGQEFVRLGLHIDNDAEGILQKGLWMTEGLQDKQRLLVDLRKCIGHGSYVSKEALLTSVGQLATSASSLQWPGWPQPLDSILSEICQGCSANRLTVPQFMMSLQRLQECLVLHVGDLDKGESSFPPAWRPENLPACGSYHAFSNNCQHDATRVLEHLDSLFQARRRLSP